MTGRKKFVGFGFGPIQGGLFLYEAQASGRFGALTVAEVDADLVALLRDSGGVYTLNIAGPHGIRRVQVGPIELLNPRIEADRALLVERVAAADEAATAVPSVAFYDGAEGSIAWTLARGLAARTHAAPLIIYAAENNNHAAAILGQKIAARAPGVLRGAEILDTVIGKMSGVVRGTREIPALGLTPMCPGADRAFLVEEFNRILVTRPQRAARALDVFAEKDDLLPFEEAKLYGHNAAHALLAYACHALELAYVADAIDVPGLVPFVRDAFTAEAGAALIRAHAGIDPLFTPEGFAAYADDLLARMTMRSLSDSVARVGRDPERKLAYDDRLIGTLRLCLKHGTGGERFAFGAAAAYAWKDPAASAATDLYTALVRLWGREDAALAAPLRAAWGRFCIWRERARPNLAHFWNGLS
jgi:mannitol-1-phosphate 5-dehydrogenase